MKSQFIAGGRGRGEEGGVGDEPHGVNGQKAAEAIHGHQKKRAYGRRREDQVSRIDKHEYAQQRDDRRAGQQTASEEAGSGMRRGQ